MAHMYEVQTGWEYPLHRALIGIFFVERGTWTRHSPQAFLEPSSSEAIQLFIVNIILSKRFDFTRAYSEVLS